jgi:SAM-dependent methyltransferase
VGSFAVPPPRQRLWAVHARAAVGEVAGLLRSHPWANLELDAGSGVLTGQLVRAGVGVVALEERADARRQLVRALPTVPVVAGRSTNLPLATGSVAALVTADHTWWSRRPVVGEAARVLAAGGPVVTLVERADGEHGYGDEGGAPAVAGFSPATLTVHPHVGSDGLERRTEVVVWWKLT